MTPRWQASYDLLRMLEDLLMMNEMKHIKRENLGNGEENTTYVRSVLHVLRLPQRREDGGRDAGWLSMATYADRRDLPKKRQFEFHFRCCHCP
jgi:hypothetical protein